MLSKQTNPDQTLLLNTEFDQGLHYLAYLWQNSWHITKYADELGQILELIW